MECCCPYCALWLERNDRLFEDIQGNFTEVWDRIKYWVGLWLWLSQSKILVAFHSQIWLGLGYYFELIWVFVGFFFFSLGCWWTSCSLFCSLLFILLFNTILVSYKKKNAVHLCNEGHKQRRLKLESRLRVQNIKVSFAGLHESLISSFLSFLYF